METQRGRIRALAIAVAVVLVVVACGSLDEGTTAGGRTSPTRVGGKAAGGAFAVVELGEAPADSESVAVVLDDDLVVAAGGESFRSWRVGPDGSVSAEFEDEPLPESYVFTAGAASDGSVAVVVGSRTARTGVAWITEDGEHWDEVALPGGEADVHDVAVTDDGFVAVGNRRAAGPRPDVMFSPARWTSGDGRTWELTTGDPSVFPANGSLHAVEVVGDQLMIVGSGDDRRARAWRSDDGGVSWAGEDIVGAGGGSFMTLAADEEEVHVLAAMAETEGGASALFTSDGSGSWAQADLQAAVPIGEMNGRVRGRDGVVLLLVSSRLDASVDADACYSDPERCTGFTTPDDELVVVRRDGGWRQIDPDALPAGSGPVEFGHLPDGRTWFLARGRFLEVWLGPADVSELPLLAPIEGAPPTDGLPPLAEYDGVLGPGVVYRYPLNIHCGMQILGAFNGRYWWRVDGGVDVETGAGEPIPDNWPQAGQELLGTVELVEPDRAEYSLPDIGVVAVYEARDQRPPGCD